MVTTDQLQDRKMRGQDEADAAIRAMKPKKDGLEERIERARSVDPQGPKDFHCVNCFRRGRDAALRIIDGA